MPLVYLDFNFEYDIRFLNLFSSRYPFVYLTFSTTESLKKKKKQQKEELASLDELLQIKTSLMILLLIRTFLPGMFIESVLFFSDKDNASCVFSTTGILQYYRHL